jgi:HNH endonuclease
MTTIELTKGKKAIVDANMEELLNEIAWKLNGTYAVGTTKYKDSPDGKRSPIMMHRFIWETWNGPIPDGMFIDHIDRDSLNNQLNNLRIATESQSAMNRSKYKKEYGCTSIYKGVILDGNKWRAYIGRDYIGMFDSEIDAAKAYDEMAIKKYKEFAKTNFPINL